MTNTFAPDTAGEIMVKNVPTATPSDTVAHVESQLAKNSWDDIHSIYITSEEKGLLGVVPIHKLLIADKKETMEKIMSKVKLTVESQTDQEKVVIEAIREDAQFVPVVDKDNHLLGAITADQIVDILHEEHLEDLLRSSGIRGKGSRIMELMTAQFHHQVFARLPWLLVGLGVGLAASLVVSRFEDFLNHHVALAFFISMIAYVWIYWRTVRDNFY